MIDINTIISQALAAAVTQAIQPLQQEYANKMAEMAEKIATLTDRVAMLENQALVVSNAVDTRIAAVETKLTEADLFTKTAEGHVNKDELLEYLDNQEWFWNKIRTFTDGAVEQAVEQHCEEYDHDDMLMSDALPDMDDYIKREDLDSEVRDAVHDVMADARIVVNF